MIVILLATLLVYGWLTPITPDNIAQIPGNSYQEGPFESDLFVIQTVSGYVVQYPLYTAVLNGDTLTRDLLGTDHELAIAALGYHDQTPFRLMVRVESYILDNQPGLDHEPTMSPLVDKDIFDLWESNLDTTKLVSPRTIHLPLPKPYKYYYLDLIR